MVLIVKLCRNTLNPSLSILDPLTRRFRITLNGKPGKILHVFHIISFQMHCFDFLDFFTLQAESHEFFLCVSVTETSLTETYKFFSKKMKWHFKSMDYLKFPMK